MEISNSVSVSAIVQELGARLKQTRLNRNITQAAIAQTAGLSRKKVMQAERGDADLTTMAMLLKALGMVEQLNGFLPPVPVSPLQLAKLSGKRRERASGEGKGDDGEQDNHGASAW